MALRQTTWEDRNPYYGDIEQLISLGFLSSNVKFKKNLNLKFRSLNTQDYKRIYYRSELGSLRDWKAWVIAESVWMINSEIILGKSKLVKEIYAAVRGLPAQALNLTYLACTELADRTSIALKGIQAYSYESVSRQKWLYSKNQLPNSESLTGFEGTSNLGLNLVQQLWICFNEIEDRRLMDLQEWSRVRQTMAPHLQKSSWEHLVNHDKNAQSKVEVERQETLDLFYYRATNILDWSEDFYNSDYRKVLKKKSTQDLAEEYKAWNADELDTHDMIVEAVKQRIRDNWKNFQDEQQQLQAERAQILQDHPAITSRTEIVGMTLDQIKLSNPQAIVKHTIVNLYDEDQALKDKLYKKHIEQGDTSISMEEAVKNRRLIVDE